MTELLRQIERNGGRSGEKRRRGRVWDELVIAGLATCNEVTLGDDVISVVYYITAAGRAKLAEVVP